MTSLYQTVAPSDTIISLAELKADLGITTSDDDTRLTELLEGNRDFIENEVGLCFTDQTWVQTYASFPCSIVAAKNPVQTITVQYYDSDNALQTLDSDEYYTIKNNLRHVLKPVDSWPTTYDRPEAVVLTLECGFTALPARVKRLALKLANIENEDREGAYLKQTNLGIDRYILSLRKSFLA